MITFSEAENCYLEADCRNCDAPYRVEDHAQHNHLERFGHDG